MPLRFCDIGNDENMPLGQMRAPIKLHLFLGENFELFEQFVKIPELKQ
jgi:hypothetical protein